MPTRQEWGEALRTTGRFLFFRPVKLDTERLYGAYLTIGLLSAWAAGIGRYWDNPRASFWQHLGLGSVLYVFAFSLLLWLILMPLRPARWTYRNVLIFVALASPPGILYAIPVERFFSLTMAQAINFYFLLVVAAWRVALLIPFLRRAASLSAEMTVIATLLPVTLIIAALTMLNLEHAVFNLMAGLQDERTSHDGAYFILMLITGISVWTSPILLILYIAAIVVRWPKPSDAAPSAATDAKTGASEPDAR